MKEKILIISEVFYPEIGSGANRMTNMTLKLKECGYKVDVVTSIPKYPSKELYEDKRFWNKEKEELLNEGSNIYRISPSKVKLTSNFFTRLYIYIFFVFKSLIKILSLKEKYDVVIVTEPSIFMGILGIVSKCKFGCKFIFDIRDLWPECLKNISIFKKSKFILNFGYLFEGFIFRFTDALMINSEGFKNYILDKGYKKDIVFVPNGLSDEDRDKNMEIILNTAKNKRFTVIYTGMLGLPQNVTNIVKVARNLRKYEDIDFKIIGTGIQKQRILELISYYKLTNIELIEAIPKDEVLKEVAKSHIGLVHLRGDSAFDLVIPGKIIDYMGIKIPIVAGVKGYTSTIIKESNAGIVTKPDDHRAMAKAIEKLYFDDTLQSKYAQNGLEFSEDRFNWNHNIKKVDKLITKVIGGDKKVNNKRVGVFVWNHFTNDARVLRECTALVQEGYDVDLIAIEDPKDKNLKRFEQINGFNVIRVTRYPKYLMFTKKVLGFIKNNKISVLPLVVSFVIGFSYFPVLTLILALYFSILAFGKTIALLIKLHIILQMILYGIKGNYDVYHSNDLNTLPQGYICSKIIRKRKLVYDSHEVQTSRTGYSGKVYYIEKFFVKRVDKMLMTTKTRADYTMDLYKNIKIDVIHNYPFNTGDESIKNKYDLYKILDIPENQPILLYQGGIQQGRGLENIVQAIPYFKRGITVFIGDGKIKPKIKEMVNELGVEDKVRFLDKVPVNELKYYTANAYLGFQVLNNVCFNHYSALSNKLFEYIMSDIPVVACNFPEIKRVVEGEKIGICIDSHDYKKIANAVNTILENKSLHEEFKKNCKETKKKYNWDNEKLKFVNIYDDLFNETEINIIDDNISIGV